MSNYNGLDTRRSGMSRGNVEPDEIRRPQGTYDRVIRFIEMFPLRLPLWIVLTNMYVGFYAQNQVLFGDRVISLLIHIPLGILFVGEIFHGFLTGIIKGLLIQVVMRAEDKAAML